LGPVTDPMLEAYTTLGFMAGVTKRVKLGTMVTGVIYREPAVLIKAVTTLDVVSGGRAYLGIGAGWNEEEAVALGLPRPLGGGRFEKLEETLILARQMWSGDETPYHGRYYHLERPLMSPQPVTKPHPPILIGGSGEQKTLRLVAQYGDASNFFGGPELSHKLEVLKRHCDDVGRDFDDIEKTSLARIDVVRPGNRTSYCARPNKWPNSASRTCCCATGRTRIFRPMISWAKLFCLCCRRYNLGKTWPFSLWPAVRLRRYLPSSACRICRQPCQRGRPRIAFQVAS
jgi:F420-dependent oxidoreductase-like protein